MSDFETNIPELAKELRSILHAQTRLLDAIIHHLSAGNPAPAIEAKDVVDTILLMIQGVGVSTHSVLRLTAQCDMSVRDCFGIARSMNELAINICYIVASGSSSAQRASRHALQKQYRDLRRSMRLGGVDIEIGASGLPDPASIPGLREALEEFTTRKGEEVREWTPLSLDARIAEVTSVNRSAGICLATSTAMIYRHSSELLHGTLFSIRFFWTDQHGRPATTREAYTRIWMNHFTTVFSASFAAVASIVELVGTMFAVPTVKDDQRALDERVRRWLGSTNLTDEGDLRWSAEVRLRGG